MGGGEFPETLVYEPEPLGIRVEINEPGPIGTDFIERSQGVLSRPGPTISDR